MTTSANNNVETLRSLVRLTSDIPVIPVQDLERIASVLLPIILSNSESMICKELANAITQLCKYVDNGTLPSYSLIFVIRSILGAASQSHVLYRCLQDIHLVLAIYDEILPRQHSAANTFYAITVMLNSKHVEYLLTEGVPCNADILLAMKSESLQVIGSCVTIEHKIFPLVLEIAVTEKDMSKHLLSRATSDLREQFIDICIKSKQEHLLHNIEEIHTS